MSNKFAKECPTANQALSGFPKLAIPTKDNGTKLDLDKYIAKLQDDDGLRHWFALDYPGKSEHDFQEWLRTDFAPTVRQRVGPIVVGAQPVQGDPSLRYSFIPSAHGRKSITIRWWLELNDHSGYHFDFIDHQTGQSQPPALDIWQWENGNWHEIISFTEGARRCLQESIIHYGPPWWSAEPGSKLRLMDTVDGFVVAEVFVPQILGGEYTQYMPFTSLAAAMANTV